MILLGNDFWKAYNGMCTSKFSGAPYDVLADLEQTCSAVFQNKLRQEGIKFDEATLDDKISSYETLIPGSTGKDPKNYFSRENGELREVAAATVEGDDAVKLEIMNRMPTYSKGLGKH